MTKSLSHNSAIPPEDVSKHKMQQANVVRCSFLPPHKNAAVAVQPRVDALDDPAARAMSAAALGLFFTARADVWRVASAAGRAANGFGVVPFVAT